jgi:hypothetical protein
LRDIAFYNLMRDRDTAYDWIWQQTDKIEQK